MPSNYKVAQWKSLPAVRDENALVARLAPMAIRLAQRLCQGRSEEADAISGALEGVLEAVRTYDAALALGESLKTRAYRFAHRRMIDRLRQTTHGRTHGSRRRNANRVSLDALPPVFADRRQCRMLSAVDDRDEAEALVGQLPAGRLREVFRMYHLQGLNCREIGREIGKSESRASQLLSEAARLLTGDPDALQRKSR